mmetsp:Transcript_60933/g.145117  ORF Transcript_60933/g.145117 Transcript_60933/m.145117 type:complete len:233 (+) Transcript_60933:1170-1868(+)
MSSSGLPSRLALPLTLASCPWRSAASSERIDGRIARIVVASSHFGCPSSSVDRATGEKWRGGTRKRSGGGVWRGSCKSWSSARKCAPCMDAGSSIAETHAYASTPTPSPFASIAEMFSMNSGACPGCGSCCCSCCSCGGGALAGVPCIASALSKSSAPPPSGRGSVENSSWSMSLPDAAFSVLKCFPCFTSKSCSMMFPAYGTSFERFRMHSPRNPALGSFSNRASHSVTSS